MFAFQIIITLLLVSGFIAYIGDKVGRYFGKKRFLLFGLRPRYTAIAVTVFAGIIIALLTGTILFILSADVRTAFFGLDKLKSEIKQKSFELEEISKDKTNLLKEIESTKKIIDFSKKEISNLSQARANLLRQVKLSRSGQLLFKVNDVITNTIIKADNSKEDIKEQLRQILAATDSNLIAALGGSRRHYIIMPSSELDEAAEYIMEHRGSVIVRIVAARNIISGEDIPCHFQLFKNLPVFKKGDRIIEGQINGADKLPEIEQAIKDLLSRVNDISKSKGVIPDAAGSVGTIPYSKIFETAKAIAGKAKVVNLKIIASKDIYSIGPLEIDIQLKAHEGP